MFNMHTVDGLHDIDEEEKEYASGLHSERLAIAYGLLHTPNGSPIRIVKNLRVCRDCHEVIKLISEVYNREIIVRDSTISEKGGVLAMTIGNYVIYHSKTM